MSVVEIYKEFGFESAHFLPNVPEEHKCRRLHGHSFKVVVRVSGEVDSTAGWHTDFGDVKKVVTPLVERLDHYCLNDVEGLSNPTSENIAVWFWERLADELPGLCEITVKETCTSGCSYRGVS